MNQKYYSVANTLLFIAIFFLSAFLIRITLGHHEAIPNFVTSIESQVHNPTFWVSSYGLTLKLLINILVSFAMLKVGLLFFQVQAYRKQLFYTVILAANIFIIQLWFEYLFIKFSAADSPYLQFNFLSVNQLFILAGKQPTRALQYVFDSINLFEVSFWMLLQLLLSKRFQLSIGKSVKIVTIFYIMPQLVFISIITFISLFSS